MNGSFFIGPAFVKCLFGQNRKDRAFAFCKPSLLKLVCVLAALLSLTSTHSQPPHSTPDSVVATIAPEYNKVSGFHRFWLGEGYRKLWAAEVKLKVLDLQKEKGGLTILQAGGGLQTKSLRLKDANGNEWVIRSIQKYPERALPPNLRKTVAKDILQDQVITGHPYSALTVPLFAGALGIPHSHPQIVFLKDDPALGKYRKDFADSVLLFEERTGLDSFRTDNTEKLQRKLQEDNDTKVDQKLVLRARLLDLLLGDWDRHEDQWRWEKRKTEEGTVYTPWPRDRDKVYYNSSGVLPWFLSHQWLKSNIQNFHKSIRDVNGYNFNNRYFDRYFLTSLDEEDWKEQIHYVQKNITDSLIDNAIKTLPGPIYNLSGEKIAAILKDRKQNLEKLALKYYRFLSKYVDIPGSDKHELFEVNQKDNGHSELSIYKIKKNRSREQLIYHREFNPKQTKEIRLYGLNGNDIFSVTGYHKSPIKIRMIGGSGTDSFYVSQEDPNKGKMFIYDLKDEENRIPDQKHLKVRTSTDSLVNAFDKHSFKYDRIGPIFLLHYSLDKGLQLRPGFLYEKQGFRKEPYSEKHEFIASYTTGRRSFAFDYTGDLKQVVGPFDLLINFSSLGPHNLSNFFGIGNETVFDQNSKQISYYRNRYDLIDADIRLKKHLKYWDLSAGPAIQYYTAKQSNNDAKFLYHYDQEHPDEAVFSDQFFGGIAAGAEFDTRRNELLPTHGINWNTTIRGMWQLGGETNSYGRVLSVLSAYKALLHKDAIVLGDRIGGGTTLGNPAYYQQMQLGGVQNLRGFHSIRFTGTSIFYNDIELRVKLLDFSSYLFPGKLGLVGFNDVGRVWTKGEQSNSWHDGYGGGIYLVPADLVIFQALIGHSKEGTYPYISFGVEF
jgi:hypothetical protein